MDEMRGRGLPMRVVDDALLVASELVSNAVRHGAPLAATDGCIEVRWEIAEHRVHLRVRDGGPGPENGAPRAQHGSSDDERGRGLTIISLLATSWGSAYDDGATVWADLPVAATAEQQATEDAERRQEA